MIDMIDMFDTFYKGKTVFLTGHTGFKGSWMSVMLVNAGAKVIGYSTCSKEGTRLFDLCGVKDQITHIKGDVRDLPHLTEAMREHQPEIVIHMAAQPIKVYENKEWEWGYRENEPLDGYDPYSNSKSCSELVTHSYKNSFFTDGRVAVSTARAGNVIGGGDFANDRIIPDCVRAAIKGEDIIVRNPYSTRPYQHVLEPVYAYLMIAAAQYRDPSLASWYNVGPDDIDCFQTGALVDLFVRRWGNDLKWTEKYDGGPHEANFLKLDCSKLKTVFGWKPRWNMDKAIEKVVEWSKAWIAGEDVRTVMNRQIEEFLSV